MSDMSDKIKALRERHELTLEQVGAAVGVSKSTVRKWETGQIANMRRDKIAALAQALHTTPEYLMGWIPDPEADVLPGMTPYQPARKVPLLGRVSAGLPLLAEENIEGYVFVDYTDQESYYSLRVQGDSMTAAGIDPGDLVIVRQQTMVDPGQIAVVLVNGFEATIKYFQQQGDLVVLTPKSLNPTHQPQIYNIKDTPVKIIGRVIEIRKQV